MKSILAAIAAALGITTSQVASAALNVDFDYGPRGIMFNTITGQNYWEASDAAYHYIFEIIAGAGCVNGLTPPPGAGLYSGYSASVSVPYNVWLNLLTPGTVAGCWMTIDLKLVDPGFSEIFYPHVMSLTTILVRH